MSLRSASLQHPERGGSRNCAAGAALCGWLTEQPLYLYSNSVEMGMGPAEAAVAVMGHHYSSVWVIKHE